jgi:hypothetical protein
MKLSEIKNCLNQSEISTNFRIELEKEILEISKQNKGNSYPIILIEDCSFNFTIKELKSLCLLFFTEKLTNRTLEYIVDALLLSENVKFETEKIINMIEEMTDPEVNGVFSLNDAKKIILSF